MKITHAASLTNPQLTAELGRLAHAERQATVALIVHLAEFDARRLHLGAGFPSLYDYCMRVLHFTEDIACNRIAAARIARRHPVVLEMLGDGRLSPTTARLLKRYLTRANHEELRAAACWKSKRQVEELLAQRYPQADVPASIRVLPAPLTAPLTSSEPAGAPTPGLSLADVVAGDSPAPVAPVPPPPRVRP